MVDFATRPGGHRVAIIVVPTAAGKRHVHFSKDDEHSWTIRDYISGSRLDGGDNRHRTATEIVNATTHFVPLNEIPGDSVKETAFWNAFLRQRSQDDLGHDVDFVNPPNPDFGEWQPF